MAQAGFTPISLYFSSTAAAVPTSGNLANGELALNIADMKLYAKNSAGVVTLLASSGGAAGTVSSVAVSGGTTGLTTSGGPITTSGTITLAGTLATTNGGTGLTSFTSGGVVYASSTSALATGSGLVFDGSNLGLGVTPSAWLSSIRALQVNNTGMSLYTYSSSATVDQYAFLTNNSYQNSSVQDIYVRTKPAAQYRLFNGTHAWFNAPSGTAGNAISFTQAMTLSGTDRTDLLIGTTTSTYSVAGRGAIEVNGSSTSIVALKVGGSAAGYVYHSGSDLNIVNTYNNAITFGTNGATRITFGAAGQFGIGPTPSYGSSGEVLTSGGSGAAPTWAAAGGGSQAFVAFGSTGGF